ncbi:hypothetical protein BU26DRAFT_570080 [Trematosphaeria pertusa]|uniref:Uncharacterized protein n=1 Tax=Trematosphaeria pertusa TaxID=390896 RepID=A0A6A6I0G8_9PLEO|nr:uncharacterized protein BU26DRAFT_570080 [Trematosphaeria pertusa]KAF2243383.1 hypothetical protein BU26DRAFT_570080 [Trematosphaeria pertusa]
MPNPQHDLTRAQIDAREAAQEGTKDAESFQPNTTSKSAMKQHQDQEDYEARASHSNSGSNTHSGQGMEYVTRKTHSSRKDEEGLGEEVVHGGWSGHHKKV